MSAALAWLFALGSAYLAVTLYWARRAGAGQRPEDFLTAPRSLPSFAAAMTLAGAGAAAWLALGLPDLIAAEGMALAPLALAAVVMPATGLLFHKRLWMLSVRTGRSSLPALLAEGFASPVLAVVTALVALLAVLAFGGMQMAALAQLFAAASGDSLGGGTATLTIAAVLLASTLIGGMRGVGLLGTIQAALLAATLAGAALAALALAGGFGAINAALDSRAADPAAALRFELAGVIQFVGGQGSGPAAGSPWTAAMILSTMLAFLGFQASPAAVQIALAARNARGFAPGATWVAGGVFGGLAAGGLVVLGAWGLLAGGTAWPALLAALAPASPWLAASLYLGLLAGVHLVAGASLVAAAEALVEGLYRPYFHRTLSPRRAVALARILIAAMVACLAFLSTWAPGLQAMLGALALPAAAQLVPPLLALLWFPRLTAPAVVAGAVLGLVAVVLTEDLGRALLLGLGLPLPWGRWPWTIHSAGWGLACNVAAVLVLSAIGRTRAEAPAARLARDLARALPQRRSEPRLRPAAWAAVLAWSFLAIGPGLVLGQRAFAATPERPPILGMPSLWAWVLIGWGLGVLLLWFLAYRLGLATADGTDLRPAPRRPVIPDRTTGMQAAEVHRLSWTLLVLGAIVTALVWVFGN